jgi:hypothetical protein
MFITEPTDVHHPRWIITHADQRPFDVAHTVVRAHQLASAGDTILKQDIVRRDNGHFEYQPPIPDGWMPGGDW